MTVTVGVIGCGYWGPNLVRVFQECDGAHVEAVCDVDLERLLRMSRRYPTLRCYPRAAEILSRKDIQLVAVATPLASHFELAKAAIEHGKHVLVEKPFTRTVAEAEELIDLANRNGVLLAVDHTFLFTPAVEKMKELIAAGDVGKIHYIDSVRINLGLIQDELDVVWDLAPHDLSIVDALIDREPTRVVATGASHTAAGQVDVAYINLDYGDGLIANFHVSWLSPVKVRRMMFGGERRMIIFDDLSNNEKIRVFDSGMAPAAAGPENGKRLKRIDYRVGDIWTPHLPPKEALSVEAEHLVSAIRDGTPLRSDGSLGLRVVRILEACGRSLCEDGARVLLNGATVAQTVATLPIDGLAPSMRHGEPMPVKRRNAETRKRESVET